MKNKTSIKIGGPAGYGIKTTGQIFSKTALRSGLNVFGMTEYPSLIRGGHNVYYTRAEQAKVLSNKDNIGFLIALNAETVRKHRDELKNGGGILFDPDKLDISTIELSKKIVLYPVPINKLAKESTKDEIMRNTVALGAMSEIVGLDFEILSDVINDVFVKKSKKIAKLNITAAKAGFDYAKKEFKNKFEHKIHAVKNADDKRILITGNEAVAFGAIAASCAFFSAYPMTPSSSILHTLATHAVKSGMVVKHAEDEIAVINMAIGAGYAGVRSMCATSGGGFALMNEAFGLAGITETPIVVVEVQRPGPATGLPTWHGQGDLEFVLHSAQGEFPRVIIAPGDVSECFYSTAEAFNIAEKFQTPVLLLSDKHLGESTFTTKEFDSSKIKIDRGKLLSQKELNKIKDYQRYELSKDGVSRRSIPGMKGGRFLANSDEHEVHGLTSEDAKNAVNQMDKRMQKEDEIRKYLPNPALRGDPKAKITIVSWGSTKGAILEAIKMLKAEKINVNFLQIEYIWPFKDKEVLKQLKKAKRVILVEGNYNGQLGRLIRRETSFEIKERLLRYDGRPISPEQIVEFVKKKSK